MAVRAQDAELEAKLQTAVSHHRAGRLSEAQQLYRDILQFLPDHPVVNNSLGIALKGQGKSSEAEAVFRRLASVAPDYAPAHSNLGNILFEQGKLAEAEASYRRALAVNPDMADALKNLGLVIVDSGRYAESFPWFRRHAELAYARPDAASQALPHKAKHDQEQREYLTQVAGAAAPMFRLEEGARVAGKAVNPDASEGEIAQRWFAWPNIAFLSPVPVLTALFGILEWRAIADRKAELSPFVYAVLLFSLSYLGIAISLFPMIVPHHYDLWQAASSPDTQIFLGVGTLFLLPVILVYTGWSYWVFRGKVRADTGYH